MWMKYSYKAKTTPPQTTTSKYTAQLESVEELQRIWRDSLSDLRTEKRN